MRIDLRENFGLDFRGILEVTAINEEGFAWTLRKENHISDSAVAILLGFFVRDLDNKMLAYIDIGTGGDVNPDTGLDTGARVAERDDETEVRELLFRADIGTYTADPNTNEVSFTAVVRPEDGNSDQINEFGLMSYDGTMFSHLVTEADPGSGRAFRYEKTNLLYLVGKWTIIPVLRRS